MEDWQDKLMKLNIEEKKNQPLKRNFRIIELPEQRDAIEYVSPYMILNNTGYLIEISPNRTNQIVNGPDQAILKPLILENGKQADLLMETNIEEIFDSTIKDDIFAKTQIRLKIHHPSFGMILIENIEIHNFGSKLIKLNALKGGKLVDEYQLICDVKHKKSKRLVIFSSPVLFKNELNSPIVVII